VKGCFVKREISCFFFLSLFLFLSLTRYRRGKNENKRSFLPPLFSPPPTHGQLLLLLPTSLPPPPPSEACSAANAAANAPLPLLLGALVSPPADRNGSRAQIAASSPWRATRSTMRPGEAASAPLSAPLLLRRRRGRPRGGGCGRARLFARSPCSPPSPAASSALWFRRDPFALISRRSSPAELSSEAAAATAAAAAKAAAAGTTAGTVANEGDFDPSALASLCRRRRRRGLPQQAQSRCCCSPSF